MYDKTDLLSKKYELLEEIKLLSGDKSWNKAGRNFIGLFMLVPDGIKRLRLTLKKLPPRDFDILTQENIVNKLFDQTMMILEKKQFPYRFIGKRLIKTQEFYTEYYEKGLKIVNEYTPKTEPKNDKHFRG